MTTLEIHFINKFWKVFFNFTHKQIHICFQMGLKWHNLEPIYVVILKLWTEQDLSIANIKEDGGALENQFRMVDHVQLELLQMDIKL